MSAEGPVAGGPWACSPEEHFSILTASQSPLSWVCEPNDRILASPVSSVANRRIISSLSFDLESWASVNLMNCNYV